MADPEFIVDTGPIVAALNRRDIHHDWARSVFASLTAPPVTCEAVLTEVCWHLRQSPDAVARVLEMPPRGDLLLYSLADDEGIALASLMRKYGKAMDLADACLVRLSEMFPNAKVVTTDVSHFRLFRRNRNQSVSLIHP